jgi:hypothetical protein
MRTDNEEAPLVVTLWGRQWTSEELLARVGRLEQLAGIRLVEGRDGAERGVRMLRCWSGAGFDFEVLVDRGSEIGALVGHDAIDAFARGARDLAGQVEAPA